MTQATHIGLARELSDSDIRLTPVVQAKIIGLIATESADSKGIWIFVSGGGSLCVCRWLAVGYGQPDGISCVFGLKSASTATDHQ
jgi:hypothetical protein